MQSLWMLFATFLFSLMGVCVKLALNEYSAPELVMYRSFVGAVLLGVLSCMKGYSLKTAYPLAHLWRATVGATAFGLWFFSFQGLPLATAMTLNYMSPIWIACILFGVGLLHKKIGIEWKFVAAILASFIGVILLLQPTFAANQWQSAFIALLSGILAALAYLQVKHLGDLGEPEYRVVFYFCTLGTVGGGIVAYFSSFIPGSDPIAFHSHSLNGVILIILIGLFAAIGQMAMTRAYHMGKTLVTANLQYSGIVFSSIWGIMVWDDKTPWIGWLGMGLIILSGISATFIDIRGKIAAATIKNKAND